MSIAAENTKHQLHLHCQQYVADRINSIQNVLDELQQSLQNETKSSVGDKYETSRAMVQAEQSRAKKQLAEAQKLKADLSTIDPHRHSSNVQIGSLVQTDKAIYYLAIPAGKLLLNNLTYYLISPKAPIALAMLGKLKGEEFSFNGQEFVIGNIT